MLFFHIARKIDVTDRIIKMKDRTIEMTDGIIEMKDRTIKVTDRTK